ncbi:flagellar biosynthetic protein FliR [Acetobacter sp. AN02]|uniref:flagellar biosynthetic protein FliR n=1 Tax=Acetobacter sp. AN02 TaxID=2894186 RepID=UPI002434322D|nr:flagellar biosynthetic protein FliR [Acetobacter sp. AN02]
MIRAGLALTITVLLFPVVSGSFTSLPRDDVLRPAFVLTVLCGEIICGLLIGWLTQLVCLAMPVAMQILATLTGLSSVLQPDPDLGAQSTAPILYARPLLTMTHRFAVFPPGHLLPAGDVAAAVTHFTSASFTLAFQLATPFVLIGTLWPAFLGLLNRFSPSIQVYSIAMPAQLLGDVLLLALFIRTMIASWNSGASDLLSGLPGF